MNRAARVPMVYGDARFTSRFLSNEWHLVQDDTVLARLRRIPSRHTSELELPERGTLLLVPEGWGTVLAEADDGTEEGRIVRRSWWGRAWEITGPGFAFRLSSDPLPRRWSLRYGSEPVGRLAGGLVSYNSVDLHTDVAIPVTGLALAWHVIARPWEQAATPGALVPRSQPGKITDG
jgi:hypothetical protein